jgi:uncharacterized membrane protein YjfL (UPF0719 family)
MQMWHPDSLWMAVVSTVVFGLIGIILTIVGYKLFDLVSTKIDVDRELTEKQNIAVAIVAGSVIIGTAIVIAAVVGG